MPTLDVKEKSADVPTASRYPIAVTDPARVVTAAFERLIRRMTLLYARPVTWTCGDRQ